MPGFDKTSNMGLFLIAAVSDDIRKLAEGPALAWIRAVNEAAAASVRGPVEQTLSGAYVRTSSHVDVPALRARIFLAGYDGMWISAGRDELAPIFGKADAVLVLGDNGSELEGRLEYLLDGREVVRAIAHREAKKPKGTFDVSVHGDWTSREGAMAVFKPLVMQMAKRTAGS